MTQNIIPKLLGSRKKNSRWLEWVKDKNNQESISARRELNIAFSHLSSTAKRTAKQRIVNGSVKQTEATLYELITYDLLYRKGFQPEYEPKIGKQTPDLLFHVRKESYIGEVFLTHSPQKTVHELENENDTGYGCSYDKGDRAQKISNTIEVKAKKYAECGYPLVLFGFLGDRHILECSNFEEALFGKTIEEFDVSNGIPKSNNTSKNNARLGSLFPKPGQGPSHQNISAVICCDWFTTLDKDKNGRRLACEALHHFDPNLKLSNSAFYPFPQVLWLQQFNAWIPMIHHSEPTAARFYAKRGIEFREYTSSDPW